MNTEHDIYNAAFWVKAHGLNWSQSLPELGVLNCFIEGPFWSVEGCCNSSGWTSASSLPSMVDLWIAISLVLCAIFVVSIYLFPVDSGPHYSGVPVENWLSRWSLLHVSLIFSFVLFCPCDRFKSHWLYWEWMSPFVIQISLLALILTVPINETERYVGTRLIAVLDCSVAIPSGIKLSGWTWTYCAAHVVDRVCKLDLRDCRGVWCVFVHLAGLDFVCLSKGIRSDLAISVSRVRG